jgi:hypothetical protein
VCGSVFQCLPSMHQLWVQSPALGKSGLMLFIFETGCPCVAQTDPQNPGITRSSGLGLQVCVTAPSLCFFGLFFWWDWVWTQGFMLEKQALYCLNHTASPFFSGYFGDGGLTNYLPGLASNCVFLISASQVAGITGYSLYFIYCNNLFPICHFFPSSFPFCWSSCIP